MRRDDLRSTIHDFLEQDGLRPPWAVKEPDYLCFIAYAAGGVITTARRFSDVDKVNFVVSHKHKVSQHIQEFHGDPRQQMDSPYREAIGELIAADMQNELPLQAADLSCWHFQRHFAKTTDVVDEGRLWRLGQTDGFLHENTSSDLGEVGKRLAGRVRFNMLFGDHQANGYTPCSVRIPPK
jgi:hypothetical protein